MTRLLLRSSVDLFDVVKVLLDGRTVRDGFEDLFRGRRRVGAKECDLTAVEHELGLLPAATMRETKGVRFIFLMPGAERKLALSVAILPTAWWPCRGFPKARPPMDRLGTLLSQNHLGHPVNPVYETAGTGLQDAQDAQNDLVE